LLPKDPSLTKLGFVCFSHLVRRLSRAREAPCRGAGLSAFSFQEARAYTHTKHTPSSIPTPHLIQSPSYPAYPKAPSGPSNTSNSSTHLSLSDIPPTYTLSHSVPRLLAKYDKKDLSTRRVSRHLEDLVPLALPQWPNHLPLPLPLHLPRLSVLLACPPIRPRPRAHRHLGCRRRRRPG